MFDKTMADTLLPLALQCAEIVRYVAELPDDLCIAEVAGAGITCTAEGDSSDMSRFARQSFRTHDDRRRVEAFGWLAGGDAVFGSDEGQCHEVGHLSHGMPPSRNRCEIARG